jgi:TM2 domain-containing membrane protein YozV
MGSQVFADPQAVFYQQYEAVRRDEIAGIILALFLGTFGAHHFYLRRTGLGIVYCLFFWTGIPAILGFLECFFMPGRVREFNAIQAAGIASALGIAVPGWSVAPASNIPLAARPPQPGTLIACPRCQRTNPSGARFCSACGTALS